MRALLRKKSLIVLFIVLFISTIIFFLKVPRYYVSAINSKEPNWGVTFSKKYTKELGLDWKETYLAILDELRVDHIRIPVYWDDIEPNHSSIDLSDYTYMLEEARMRDVSVVLSIGQRLPRWPECHTPAWYGLLSSTEKESALFDMLGIVVKSFVEYDNITHWQVENEPLVKWFGTCPPPNPDLIRKEIAFVKMLDDRPIIVTDSGELGLWKDAYALGGDVLGITTYRVTWNKWLKFIRYPFPISFYKLKARFAGIPWKNIISAELQAEPWTPGTKGLTETPFPKQYQSMSLEQFKANIDYARALEVSDVYLWGVEWWYWLEKMDHSTIWDEAKTLWSE